MYVRTLNLRQTAVHRQRGQEGKRAIRSDPGLWLPEEEDVEALTEQPAIDRSTVDVFNWLKRWLEGFPIASLDAGFQQLMHQMNQFVCPLLH